MNISPQCAARLLLAFAVSISLMSMSGCAVNWPLVIESKTEKVGELVSESRYAATMLEVRKSKQLMCDMKREEPVYLQYLERVRAAYPSDVLPASMPADLRIDPSQIVFFFNDSLTDEIRAMEIEAIASEILYASHVNDLETLWSYCEFLKELSSRFSPDDHELLRDRIQPARAYLRAEHVTLCTWRPEVCKDLVNDRPMIGLASNHMPALFKAIELDVSHLIPVLIGKGADIEAKATHHHYYNESSIRDEEYTPLHFAAYLGREDAVLELIQAGADVQARTKRGRTPLHMAAVGGWASIARTLIDNGGDPRAKDIYYVTPLAHARRYHKDGHATRLIDALQTDRE